MPSPSPFPILYVARDEHAHPVSLGTPLEPCDVCGKPIDDATTAISHSSTADGPSHLAHAECFTELLQQKLTLVGRYGSRSFRALR